MDNSFIAIHGVKLILGAFAGAVSWLLNRAIKQNDEKILKMEDRIDTLEKENIEITKLSVKMDMVMSEAKKSNKKLDELQTRLQGTELGLAKLGGRRQDD